MTLLDTLRNELELTGAKRVCDRGTCGACTVMVDGKTVYSCSMLAIEAQGKKITTVEGLEQNGQLSPVQQLSWTTTLSNAASARRALSCPARLSSPSIPPRRQN